MLFKDIIGNCYSITKRLKSALPFNSIVLWNFKCFRSKYWISNSKYWIYSWKNYIWQVLIEKVLSQRSSYRPKQEPLVTFCSSSIEPITFSRKRFILVYSGKIKRRSIVLHVNKVSQTSWRFFCIPTSSNKLKSNMYYHFYCSLTLNIQSKAIGSKFNVFRAPDFCIDNKFWIFFHPEKDISSKMSDHAHNFFVRWSVAEL